MSKMGQEFERQLDMAKYDLYRACQDALVEIEDSSYNHAHSILEHALSKVEEV